MKYLMIMLALLSTQVIAEEVPVAMKDGVIVVTLKSGKQYTYSLNEYKVVRRGKADGVQKSLSSKSGAAAQYKNRVRVLGGIGPTDIGVTNNGSTVIVKSTNGAVGGLGYDRMVSERISIGGQALTNGTYLLDLGLDF